MKIHFFSIPLILLLIEISLELHCIGEENKSFKTFHRDWVISFVPPSSESAGKDEASNDEA